MASPPPPPAAQADPLSWFSWCDIPTGEVAMGTPADSIDSTLVGLGDLQLPREWIVKETPRHIRNVPGFRITRHAVTNGQLSEFARRSGLDWAPAAAADHPAVVSHEVAEAFATWLSQESGLTVALPAEEQWERAARGDDLREYPWGDRFTPNHANMDHHSLGTTAPVGSYPKGASPFGLLDMAGNLDEWTSTVYSAYPGAGPEVATEEVHALSPFITRGGGWNHYRDTGRCSRRHGVFSTPSYVGFRVVADQ